MVNSFVWSRLSLFSTVNFFIIDDRGFQYSLIFARNKMGLRKQLSVPTFVGNRPTLFGNIQGSTWVELAYLNRRFTNKSVFLIFLLESVLGGFFPSFRVGGVDVSAPHKLRLLLWLFFWDRRNATLVLFVVVKFQDNFLFLHYLLNQQIFLLVQYLVFEELLLQICFQFPILLFNTNGQWKELLNLFFDWFKSFICDSLVLGDFLIDSLDDLPNPTFHHAHILLVPVLDEDVGGLIWFLEIVENGLENFRQCLWVLNFFSFDIVLHIFIGLYQNIVELLLSSDCALLGDFQTVFKLLSFLSLLFYCLFQPIYNPAKIFSAGRGSICEPFGVSVAAHETVVIWS